MTNTVVLRVFHILLILFHQELVTTINESVIGNSAREVQSRRYTQTTFALLIDL